MKFTIEEGSKALANRVHQQHYVEWVMRKCLDEELAFAREIVERLLPELEHSDSPAIIDARRFVDGVWP